MNSNLELILDQQIFTVNGLLTPTECCDLIELSENIGFQAATVHTAAGHQRLQDWRNNTRVTLDDPNRAAMLWQRVKPFFPKPIDNWIPCGVNERLRFYRYEPGQKFDWHTDGFFLRDNGDKSFFTFMVYLNQDVEGGETCFQLDPDQTRKVVKVKPKTGLALFFSHPFLHKGDTVIKGIKYVLRTDVMFQQQDSLTQSTNK